MEKKNFKPWLATALSFVFAGLGHIYVGSYLKGIVFIVLDSFLIYVILTYSGTDWVQVLSAVISIAVSFDAYNLALAKPGKENKIIENKPEIQKELKIY
jgi:cadmium resistance protein CadD (predicted permease)